jgi:hypothetical protein
MNGPANLERTVSPLERFSELLFHAESLDAVPFERVRHAVSTHSLACVRGLFDPQEMRAILRRMRDNFDVGNDRKHDPRDSEAVRRNFQKLQIGANSGIDSLRTLGRFVRALYNPIFADDIHGMRAHFRTMARFRNLLANVPADFAVEGTEKGYWTCARLLQYPRGGGFMVPHRDVYAQTATVESGLEFFQPLLLLSEKPQDFSEGGAYVDRGDERFQYEQFCQAGDLVIYDGRSVHGVADIDPMADLDMSTFSGRVVALVSLYRHLDASKDDYAQLAKRGVTLVGTGD